MNHCDAAAEWSDAVAFPSHIVNRVEVVGLQATVVEFHQTGQSHHHVLIGEAQMAHGRNAVLCAVAHVDHVAQGGALHEWLRAAVQGAGAVHDVVFCIQFLPVAQYFFGGEEVIECHFTGKVCVLDAPCQHE